MFTNCIIVLWFSDSSLLILFTVIGWLIISIVFVCLCCLFDGFVLICLSLLVITYLVCMLDLRIWV